MEVGFKFVNEQGYLREVVAVRDSGTCIVKFHETGTFHEVDQDVIKFGLVFGSLDYAD